MSETRELIVIGAGGFGREVAWAAREAREPRTVLGFLDDDPAATGRRLCDATVLGPIDLWTRFADAEFVIGVGAPRAKRAIVEKMQRHGAPRFASIVHRSVQHSSYVTFGEGSVVCAGCVLTTQIAVGPHAIVNINCTVGHDVTLGAMSNLAPLVAVSGNVTLGEGAEVGTGASLRQGIMIGTGAMLGMGAVLTKDVPANELWMGSPARRTRALDPFHATDAR